MYERETFEAQLSTLRRVRSQWPRPRLSKDDLRHLESAIRNIELLASTRQYVLSCATNDRTYVEAPEALTTQMLKLLRLPTQA